MMRFALLIPLALLTQPLFAGWVELRSGPFVVLSDSGRDDAKDALNQLEQFRGGLGDAIGKPDMKLVWPVYVVVTKKPSMQPKLAFGRAGWISTWPVDGRPDRIWFRDLAFQFFIANLPGPMAHGYEQAVADAWSTFEVKAARITFGAPPEPAARTWQWALVQSKTVNEATRTRLQVFLSNLANGTSEEISARNAFNAAPAELEREATSFLSAGQFTTATFSGRTIDTDRVFAPKEALPSQIAVIQADLLYANGKAEAARIVYQQAFNARPSAANREGLALALIALGDKENAKRTLMDALPSEPGARAYVELAKLETNLEKAREYIELAAKKNPQWLEPYVVAAAQEPGPIRKAYFLKKAVELAPRRLDLRSQLAKAQMGAQQYDEAAKTWRTAERLAPTQEERDALLAEQRAAENARLDAEEAERRRQKQEDADEVERLRKESEERIRAAEAKANEASGGVKSKQAPVDWWDGPKTEAVEGTLDRVVCAKGSMRLAITTAEGKALQLNIADPGKVGISGGGEATLACGIQKPAKRVKIEYVPHARQGGATAGEVNLIEFR